MSTERHNPRPPIDRRRVGYSYIRTGSRVQAEQEASIVRQRTACRLLAATCRLRLDQEFVDRGPVSSQARPAFERLIKAIEQRPGGVYVLLASSDRLAGTSAERQSLERAIAAAGGQVLVLESVRLVQPKKTA